MITAIIQHDSDIISGRREMSTSTAALSSSPRIGFVPATHPLVPDNPTEPTEAMPASAPQEFAQNVVPVFDLVEEEPPAPQELYPVRKPYPVKLQDPILVYRMEPRPPNLQVFYDFPPRPR